MGGKAGNKDIRVYHKPSEDSSTRYVNHINLRGTLPAAPVSKEAPKVWSKETPTVVDVDESKADSESEAGEIIDFV